MYLYDLCTDVEIDCVWVASLIEDGYLLLCGVLIFARGRKEEGKGVGCLGGF